MNYNMLYTKRQSAYISEDLQHFISHSKRALESVAEHESTPKHGTIMQYLHENIYKSDIKTRLWSLLVDKEDGSSKTSSFSGVSGESSE